MDFSRFLEDSEGAIITPAAALSLLLFLCTYKHWSLDTELILLVHIESKVGVVEFLSMTQVRRADDPDTREHLYQNLADRYRPQHTTERGDGVEITANIRPAKHRGHSVGMSWVGMSLMGYVYLIRIEARESRGGKRDETNYANAEFWTGAPCYENIEDAIANDLSKSRVLGPEFGY